MKNKKKYLSIITSFATLEKFLYVHDFLIEKLSNNFEKIFIINDQNIRFFPKIAQSIFYEDNN